MSTGAGPAFHAAPDWFPQFPLALFKISTGLAASRFHGGNDMGEEILLASRSFFFSHYAPRIDRETEEAGQEKEEEEEEAEQAAINLSAQPASQYLRLVGARN